MAQHCGYVVEVKQLRPHANADRLQIATFFGNDTCVGLDVKIGDVGIYFPADLQLSAEFCEENHMCRKRQDGTPDTGYLDPDKRNVKAIRLRGEKSDGIYCPLISLAYCFESDKPDVGVMSFDIGDTIDVVNGHEICKKYIPRSNSYNYHKEGNHTRKKKVNIAPLFAEHVDTEQLAYNLEAFKPGDEIEITLKMHGTSQRTGYLPVFKGYTSAIPWVRWVLSHCKENNKIYQYAMKFAVPVYDWGYISGTRRTVLENYNGGFYGSNEFREQHSKTFEGKLWKGETVYYEVVGFTDTGAPIMADGNNEKVGKDFVKQYGKTTTFSYGCSATGYMTYGDGSHEELPISDIYVYRMTMTNEDGDVVEYTPDFMRYRCEQMGIKCVPVFEKFRLYSGEDVNTETIQNAVMRAAETWCDGPDPIGKTHIREGVVVRIINRPKFTAYKYKNHDFKILSGIIVEAVANGEVMVDDTVIEEL